MTTLRAAATPAASVGNINASTAPLSIAAHTSTQIGDLFVVAAWFAQGLGGSNTMVTPSGFTKVTTDGTNPTRLGGVFVTIVTAGNIAALKAGTAFNSSSFSSRCALAGVSLAPEAGHEFTLAGIAGTTADWNGSTMSSDTFPAVAGTYTLGIEFTNKSASTTLTSHSAAGGGTVLTQALSPSASSGSVSDSVASVTLGGTGVSFNIAQANGIAYAVGITEHAVSTPLPWTIAEMDAFIAAGYPVYWAHRGGSANWSEMTMYAYDNAAAWGVRALEASCQRSSDGVWIMSHDTTTDRVTGVSHTIATTAAASMLGLPVIVPSGGGVLGRIDDLLAAYPDHVLILDNKTGANRTEFFALIKAAVSDWADRVIIKIDGASALAVFTDAKTAGFKTAAYFYDTTPSGTISDRMPYVDYPGLNYDAAQSYWDALLAYGKPVWGHVLTNSSMAATATSKGAKILQCADVLGIVPQLNPGTLAATLPAITAALTGQSANTGSLACTVPAVTAAIAGQATNTGTLAVAVPKVTAALEGQSTNPGTLTVTTPAVTTTVTGTQTNPAELAATLPPVTAAITGMSVNPGTLAATVASVTVAITGQATNPGTLTATLPAVTAAISDTPRNVGTLNITLPAVTAELAGQSVNPATLNAEIPRAICSITGTQTNSGILAVSLPALLAAITGGSSNPGTLAATLPAVTVRFANAIVWEIAPERTLRIPADDRTITIPAEDNTMRVSRQ